MQYFLQLQIFIFSVCVLISSQSSPKKSIKSGTMKSVLQLALFPCFSLHSLRAVAMLFNIFFLNLKKSEFYAPYFQNMSFLVTMITETFYSILLKTNKRLNEICNTWYHIPQNTLLNGHLMLKNFQSTKHINQRDVRLFCCRFGQENQNLDEILAPREEIEVFSRNINNPDNRFFFSRGLGIL